MIGQLPSMLKFGEAESGKLKIFKSAKKVDDFTQFCAIMNWNDYEHTGGQVWQRKNAEKEEIKLRH